MSSVSKHSEPTRVKSVRKQEIPWITEATGPAEAKQVLNTALSKLFTPVSSAIDLKELGHRHKGLAFTQRACLDSSLKRH